MPAEEKKMPTEEKMKEIYAEAGYMNGEVMALVCNDGDEISYKFVTAVVIAIDGNGQPVQQDIVVLSSLEEAERAWLESLAGCQYHFNLKRMLH